MERSGSGARAVRIQELDSLRGLLAVGVVLFHLFPQRLFWLWSCVDGFFVLSGFVITRLIIGNPMSFGMVVPFYLRRAFRIWPVYFLTLAVALGLNALYVMKNALPFSSIEGVPESLVFFQFVQFYWLPYADYFPYDYIRWFGHSWSLAVEEQFYWLWPIVIAICLKKTRPLVWISLALIVVGCITRATGHLVFLLAARVDGLALGAMLAIFEANSEINVKRLMEWRPRLAWVSGLVFTACIGVLTVIYLAPNYRANKVLSLHYQDSTWLIPLFAIAFASIVGSLWLFRGSDALRCMRVKPLLWLGGRSYAIYMFHPIVQALVERVVAHWSWPAIMTAFLTLGLVIWFAHLSFVYVESRFSRLRDRFPLAAA